MIVIWSDIFFPAPEAADGTPAFDAWDRLGGWVAAAWPWASRTAFWEKRPACSFSDRWTRAARLTRGAFASFLAQPRFGARLLFRTPASMVGVLVNAVDAHVYEGRAEAWHGPPGVAIPDGNVLWAFGPDAFHARYARTGA